MEFDDLPIVQRQMNIRAAPRLPPKIDFFHNTRGYIHLVQTRNSIQSIDSPNDSQKKEKT